MGGLADKTKQLGMDTTTSSLAKAVDRGLAPKMSSTLARFVCPAGDANVALSVEERGHRPSIYGQVVDKKMIHYGILLDTLFSDKPICFGDTYFLHLTISYCFHAWLRRNVCVTGVAVATPFTSRELEKRADFFRISGAGSG